MSGYGRRGYGRGGYQRSRSVSAGRVAKPNRRAGECRSCGESVPAGAGQLYREESGAWSVVHAPMEWAGSPMSGHYVGGCPGSTDAQNAGAPWNRDGHVMPEAERLEGIARTFAAVNPPGPARRSYAYTSSGARMSNRFTRCEDAPCCGCCD